MDEAPGIIDPSCAYTPRELAKRLGVTKNTVLKWRGEGLKLHGKAGGRVMIVMGADFIQWCTDTYANPGRRGG